MENQLIRATFVISGSLVLCACIGAWSVINLKSQEQTIAVTGSAKKRIKSDLVIWSASVSRQAPTLIDAYKQLAHDIPVVKDYLVSKGIDKKEIQVSSINTTAVHDKGINGAENSKIEGYELNQRLEVRSRNLDKVAVLAREATELINKGIAIQSSSPAYYCTTLGNIKIEMLSEAAKDAKLRAQRIASSTGSNVGTIRSAKMGVLQITPADSTEVSDQGINDSSSIDKDITAVVNLTFSVQ